MQRKREKEDLEVIKKEGISHVLVANLTLVTLLSTLTSKRNIMARLSTTKWV